MYAPYFPTLQREQWFVHLIENGKMLGFEEIMASAREVCVRERCGSGCLPLLCLL